MMQSTDVLVGQPITESDRVFVYKIADVVILTLNNFACLPFQETLTYDKRILKLNEQSRTLLQPDMNLITVNTDLKHDELAVVNSIHFRDGLTIVTPSNRIKICDRKGMLDVMNYFGLQDEELRKRTCVARAAVKYRNHKTRRKCNITNSYSECQISALLS